MKQVNTNLAPSPNLDKDEMKEIQRRIARNAVFQDSFDFSIEDPSELAVAGVDQAFTEDKSVSAAVVMKDGEIIEEVSAYAELKIPYIPGLLAFREGESIVKALEKLEHEPDVLVMDGSGRIHFREAGIATHIGLIFDKPSIGVAKSLLCGETGWKGDKLPRGEKIPVKSNSKVETAEEGTLIGYLFQSKQYKGERKVNPLYISSGHRISAESSVELIDYLSQGYKIPEPIRIADQSVSELKKEF